MCGIVENEIVSLKQLSYFLTVITELPFNKPAGKYCELVGWVLPNI